MRRLLTALRHRLACACGAHRDVVVADEQHCYVYSAVTDTFTLSDHTVLYYRCMDCRDHRLIGLARTGNTNRRVRA